jgi:thiol-disulfide isomerase/thioredoxin
MNTRMRSDIPVLFEEPQLETNVQTSWGYYQYAQNIYANQSWVRPLTDANFWNIFYDRNKVIVVDFWADWCRPCDSVAEVMVKIAKQYSSSPFVKHVKFYHVRLDANPKLNVRFGFESISVVFFYYTATGKPPTKIAPLLEGSLGGDDGERKFDPKEYIQRIDDILRHHGHLRRSQTGSSTTKELLEEASLLGSLSVDTGRKPTTQVTPCQAHLLRFCSKRQTLRKIFKDIRSKEWEISGEETRFERWQCNNLRTPEQKKGCAEVVRKLERLHQELSDLQQVRIGLSQELREIREQFHQECGGDLLDVIHKKPQQTGQPTRKVPC